MTYQHYSHQNSIDSVAVVMLRKRNRRLSNKAADVTERVAMMAIASEISNQYISPSPACINPIGKVAEVAAQAISITCEVNRLHRTMYVLLLTNH